MTRKVLEINEGTVYLECIKNDADKHNPFRLYTKWWDGGWHRKLLVKYANFASVIYRIKDMMLDGDGFGWW